MKNLVPLYTIWPGRNRFCCKGTYITGPSEDWCTNLFTWLCFCGVIIPYIIFVTPILWQQVSPALSIITYFLFLSTLIFLLLTQFSDPGIIPRNEIIKLMNDNQLQEYVEQEKIHSDPNQIQDGCQLNNTNSWLPNPIQIKICSTCNIIRPNRSAHCASCDNCVLVHDHHCPFVNNCIGKNNYRFFISFVISVFALTVSVVVGMICFLVLLGSSNLSSDSKSTILIVFIIPIGLSGLCVLGLCSYHLYLRCIGKTTRENLKSQVNQLDEQNQFLWISESKNLFDPRQLVEIKIREQQ